MNIFNEVSIYKKKEEEKIIILPTGYAENGLIKTQDFGFIINCNSRYNEIGCLIEYALKLTLESQILKLNKNKAIWELASEEKTWAAFSKKYNLVTFEYMKNIYSLKLNIKDGAGFSPFPDKVKGQYEFGEKIETEELGKKLIEMFKFKEEYDNS
ncbi:MAG: hypothetical protein LBV03_05630 [Fusobacteriales bacterium]|nr:hypothetical protein [Fusobacteriales bacterium]